MKVATVNFESDEVKGFVKLEILKGQERLKILKELNLTPDSEGNLSFQTDFVGSLINASNKIVQFILEVDLLVKGEQIKSVEDLEYCSCFNTIFLKLTSVMLNGADNLGNEQSRQLKRKP